MGCSGSCAVDFRENGRVLIDRCQLHNVTPWCNWSIMLEDRTCLMVEYMI